MEDLPDQVAWDILQRIKTTSHRNSVSLTCKRLHDLDNEQRTSIRVGCGLNPANEALTILCTRFHNLEKVEISYSGWMSKLGKQLDDLGLYNLSKACPFLKDLTLSYCTFITNAGLSHLALCPRLSSLKLVFAPRITGFGILSIVVGCKNLTVLHLVRCLNISSVEWLEYLGKLETLDDLCIKNCRAIGEADLIKLGNTWGKLKRLEFCVDADYRYIKGYDRLAADRWCNQDIACDSMVELKFVNGIISPILGKCANLEKIHLDMCPGVRDSDISSLAHVSTNLRSVSMRVPSDFPNPTRLTDKSLLALARNCPKIETVRLCEDGDFPSFSTFTVEGILGLVRRCPVKELALSRLCSFGNEGMEGLCSADRLENLELERCQEVTDEGLRVVWRLPNLRLLKLRRCLGVTDEGLRPAAGCRKLEVLMVEDCPQVSERGAEGAALCVWFRQDLSWMC